jgi:transposase InsO family protein
MIFIPVSATFTPFGLLTLEGWLRVSSLAAAWSLAGIGVAAVVKTSGAPNCRRVGAEAWRKEYNEDRPHSALRNLTPKEFIQTQTPERVA